MAEFQILFPEPREVLLNGARIEIYPVKFKDFEAFGLASGALLQVLTSGSMEQVTAYAAKTSKSLAKVVATNSSISYWKAKRLPTPVLVQLMVQVITVNAGFFGQAQVAAASALDGLN